MKTIKYIAFILAIVLIAQSCREDSDEYTITPPTIEPKVIVTSSVLGTVVDEGGNAVEDALVTFEGNTTTTDENGVFQFEDESMYSSGTYIKVSKHGYFDGSRTFYASESNTSIVKIELIPLNEIGEFSNASGGQVSFEYVEMDFEANSIVNEDGSAYNGTINVAAKYLDPTLVNTLNQMPGDLTGTTTSQDRVVLTSMAMIAVELLDDNGNELQVKEGKTVDVKIPVPESLLNDAPSTIPMWHFDEELGYWVEEGSAILVNGVYETALAHFSFWNCDVPNDFIFLKGSIINRQIPIQGVNVVVTIPNGGASGSDITDENGFFCGYIPNGIDLLLEVFDQCGNLIYSTTIPASETDVFLDPINLNITSGITILSGSVSSCEGEPSDFTYVVVSQGNLNITIPLNDDFTFAGNAFYCEEDVDITVVAIDPVNGLKSAEFSYSTSGFIDVGELELCEEQLTPIFILKYGAVTDTWLLYNKTNFPDDEVNTNYSVEIIETGVVDGVIQYKEVYSIIALDSAIDLINEAEITYVEGEPIQDAEVYVGLSGFIARGVASNQKVTQDGREYLISTGTLTEIEVHTPGFYDPSYVDLYYYLLVELD